MDLYILGVTYVFMCRIQLTLSRLCRVIFLTQYSSNHPIMCFLFSSCSSTLFFFAFAGILLSLYIIFLYHMFLNSFDHSWAIYADVSIIHLIISCFIFILRSCWFDIFCLIVFYFTVVLYYIIFDCCLLNYVFFIIFVTCSIRRILYTREYKVAICCLVKMIQCFVCYFKSN